MRIEWDPKAWGQAIAMVRQWNDQITQTAVDDIAKNPDMIAEDYEALIGEMASGFLQPRNSEVTPEDHLAWLALHAALLVVETARDKVQR